MTSCVSYNSSILPGSSSGDLALLLQKPRKWTHKHLEVARVKISENITAAELMGQEYVPLDGDPGMKNPMARPSSTSIPLDLLHKLICFHPELERFAGMFCAPSRKQLETGDVAGFYHLHNGGLSATFDRLWEISQVDTAASAKSGDLKCVLMDVISKIKSMTKAGERLRLMRKGSIPFEIPQLNFRGRTQGDGILVGYNEDDKSLSIPLAILSVVKEPGSNGMAKYEVAQALFPAIIAYSRNPSLKEYHGFAICYDGRYMYVIKAIVSSTYMESFCKHRITEEDLLLYRSDRFEVIDPDDRRELVRLGVSLMKNLAGSSQFGIQGHYGEGFW